MLKDCRPVLFIASSGKRLDVAKALKPLLSDVSEPQVWKHGAFSPGEGTLEALERLAVNADFAVMVATPDDVVERDGKAACIPRDNVLVEIGLFIGALGRERTFIVRNQDPNLLLPTDLLGITVCPFSDPPHGTIANALEPVAAHIKRQVEKLRFRTEHSGRLLEGSWTYHSRDANSGHEWGGEGEIQVNPTNSTKVIMKGQRTWDSKYPGCRLACDWKTTFLVIGKNDVERLTLRFDHGIRLREGFAEGSCILEIDKQFDGMKGHFYYHADHAKHDEVGHIVFTRDPPPARQSHAIAKPL